MILVKTLHFLPFFFHWANEFIHNTRVNEFSWRFFFFHFISIRIKVKIVFIDVNINDSSTLKSTCDMFIKKRATIIISIRLSLFVYVCARYVNEICIDLNFIHFFAFFMLHIFGYWCCHLSFYLFIRYFVVVLYRLYSIMCMCVHFFLLLIWCHSRRSLIRL